MKKFHYSWVIALACMVELVCTQGLICNTFGVFVVPICEEFKCSRSAVAICQTMFLVSGMAVSLGASVIYRKCKLMPLMRLSAAGAGACLIALTYMKSTALMAAISLVMGILIALTSWIPVSLLINNWFAEKKNTALGIAMTGSNVGGMLFSFLAGLLMEKLGWRVTYRTFAVAGTALLIVLNFAVIRAVPEDMGKRPYGREAEEGPAAPESGPGLAAALRTPVFYAVALASMLLCVSSNTINSTLTAHMRDLGQPEDIAAFMFTLYMACLIPAKLLIGRFFDRLGALATVLISVFAEAAGMFLMLFASSTPVAVLGAAFVSVGNGIGPMLAPVLTRDLFGTRDYSGINGMIAAATSIGGVLGVTAANAVRDMTDSYRADYIVMVPLVLLTAVMFAYAIRKGEKGLAAR